MEVFRKKGVLKNVPKFTGKHLCQGLLFNNNKVENEINILLPTLGNDPRLLHPESSLLSVRPQIYIKMI